MELSYPLNRIRCVKCVFVVVQERLPSQVVAEASALNYVQGIMPGCSIWRSRLQTAACWRVHLMMTV